MCSERCERHLQGKEEDWNKGGWDKGKLERRWSGEEWRLHGVADVLVKVRNSNNRTRDVPVLGVRGEGETGALI